MDIRCQKGFHSKLKYQCTSTYYGIFRSQREAIHILDPLWVLVWVQHHSVLFYRRCSLKEMRFWRLPRDLTEGLFQLDSFQWSTGILQSVPSDRMTVSYCSVEAEEAGGYH